MVEERVQGGFKQFNATDLQTASEVMFNLLRGVMVFVSFYTQTSGTQIK